MSDISFVILYVENAKASSAFYTDLLGRPPVQSSPNFVMFKASSGVMLGLWSHEAIEPAATAAGGGSEIAFTVADAEAVDAKHGDWRKRGLRIAQAPTDLVFARTFVALDPDGHRLRVMWPFPEEEVARRVAARAS